MYQECVYCFKDNTGRKVIYIQDTLIDLLCKDFNKDDKITIFLTPQAKEYLKFMIIVCGLNLVGMSNNSAIVAGIFSAGGDTRFGLICDFIVLWVIVVPLGLLAAFVWELPLYVVYCIIYSDEIIKLPAVWKHYTKYLWVKDLTRNKGAIQ